MSTNFYTTKNVFGVRQPDIHLGKRSFAGFYCFNCAQTLCADGEQAIHSGLSTWHKVCPICHQPVSTSACSFSWDYLVMMDESTIVVDEYGHKYSWRKFVNSILKSCPIQFFDDLGANFS